MSFFSVFFFFSSKEKVSCLHKKKRKKKERKKRTNFFCSLSGFLFPHGSDAARGPLWRRDADVDAQASSSGGCAGSHIADAVGGGGGGVDEAAPTCWPAAHCSSLCCSCLVRLSCSRPFVAHHLRDGSRARFEQQRLEEESACQVGLVWKREKETSDESAGQAVVVVDATDDARAMPLFSLALLLLPVLRRGLFFVLELARCWDHSVKLPSSESKRARGPRLLRQRRNNTVLCLLRSMPLLSLFFFLLLRRRHSHLVPLPLQPENRNRPSPVGLTSGVTLSARRFRGGRLVVSATLVS